jgi:predicted CoA-binding protein
MGHANDFLDKKNIFAIIGVSTNPDKWGFKIYDELKSKRCIVFPVNPKYDKIKDTICYADLRSLPKKPNVVITVVPPEITEKIVKECKDINIDKIWMQPGSESEKAIRFCKNNNIKIVANACLVMDNLNKNFGD